MSYCPECMGEGIVGGYVDGNTVRAVACAACRGSGVIDDPLHDRYGQTIDNEEMQP